MNYKTSSLLTLFFFLIFLIATTTSNSELQYVEVISPTEGQTVKKGDSLTVKFKSSKTPEDVIASLHVLLLSDTKYRIYQILNDKRIDTDEIQEATVPWDRLQHLKGYFYIRKYDLTIVWI
jgi:hypothetical protein